MQWNKAAAISHLNAHAGTMSRHQCARYTREAIEAGGLYIGRTRHAKDYGPLLERAGFRKVFTGEGVVAGDVIVIQAFAGNADGHMAMFNGSIWVSDFYQRNGLYPGPGYRAAKPRYQIYRKLP
ncbi:hypothetical protein RIN58_09445 [Siccibacter colletis]|uniref:hypothetical protein n=1 Tax=Siccibacter colletis TaxID=1505757 RepID=UPI0028BE8880|nr:hypothetical protein [Siccibacter colletis]WNN50290.1 hypothetical protein RIN58_09445 [Siccibacter colletis]